MDYTADYRASDFAGDPVRKGLQLYLDGGVSRIWTANGRTFAEIFDGVTHFIQHVHYRNGQEEALCSCTNQNGILCEHITALTTFLSFPENERLGNRKSWVPEGYTQTDVDKDIEYVIKLSQNQHNIIETEKTWIVASRIIPMIYETELRIQNSNGIVDTETAIQALYLYHSIDDILEPLIPITDDQHKDLKECSCTINSLIDMLVKLDITKKARVSIIDYLIKSSVSRFTYDNKIREIYDITRLDFASHVAKTEQEIRVVVEVLLKVSQSSHNRDHVNQILRRLFYKQIGD